MLTKQQYQDAVRKLHAIASTTPETVWWTLCTGFLNDNCENTQCWWEARDCCGDRLDTISDMVQQFVGESFSKPNHITGSTGQGMSDAIADLLLVLDNAYKKSQTPQTVVVNGRTYRLVDEETSDSEPVRETMYNLKLDFINKNP